MTQLNQRCLRLTEKYVFSTQATRPSNILQASLKLTDKMTRLINNIHFNLIWKNKCHYIRKADMVKTVEEGGLNVIDFSVMNGVLK
ncbi:hypothetical protein F7725_000125 [Dissostichus mawsoni]|uniref:Uncharacterized protein n=1 Tax=Dissostichus mawsoni TaxID=36200 RepID=A0A7J5ZE48_DISMA|nr:hypothetical protein F7725_000125 [Dissostichus mawsoni]